MPAACRPCCNRVGRSRRGTAALNHHNTHTHMHQQQPHPSLHPPKQDCDPDLAEDDIRLVLSADGTSLGEAFVHLHGPRAKLRLALSKDRSACPVRACRGVAVRGVAAGVAERRVRGARRAVRAARGGQVVGGTPGLAPG